MCYYLHVVKSGRKLSGGIVASITGRSGTIGAHSLTTRPRVVACFFGCTPSLLKMKSHEVNAEKTRDAKKSLEATFMTILYINSMYNTSCYKYISLLRSLKPIFLKLIFKRIALTVIYFFAFRIKDES